MSESPTKVVICAECRTAFVISARREYAHRRAGTRPVCQNCRISPRPDPTDADRQWWLDRFSLEECRELSVAIFGVTRAAAHEPVR